MKRGSEKNKKKRVAVLWFKHRRYFFITLGIILLALAICVMGYLYAEELGWKATRENLGSESQEDGAQETRTPDDYQDPSIKDPDTLGSGEEYNPPVPPATNTGGGGGGWGRRRRKW